MTANPTRKHPNMHSPSVTRSGPLAWGSTMRCSAWLQARLASGRSDGVHDEPPIAADLALGLSMIFIVLAATTFGSALLYAIRGFSFAFLVAPLFFYCFLTGTGNTARYHHLDGPVDLRASRTVAGRRAVAAAALGARWSCRAVARH